MIRWSRSPVVVQNRTTGLVMEEKPPAWYSALLTSSARQQSLSLSSFLQESPQISLGQTWLDKRHLTNIVLRQCNAGWVAQDSSLSCDERMFPDQLLQHCECKTGRLGKTGRQWIHGIQLPRILAGSPWWHECVRFQVLPEIIMNVSKSP